MIRQSLSNRWITSLQRSRYGSGSAVIRMPWPDRAGRAGGAEDPGTLTHPRQHRLDLPTLSAPGSTPTSDRGPSRLTVAFVPTKTVSVIAPSDFTDRKVVGRHQHRQQRVADPLPEDQIGTVGDLCCLGLR